MKLPPWIPITPSRKAIYSACLICFVLTPKKSIAQASDSRPSTPPTKAAPIAEKESTPPEKTEKTPSDKEVTDNKAAPALDDAIVLSPFEVTASNNGYMATNTASGTRLNSSLGDIASPISVVTKQQLTDMASVDINDIFRSETNVEGLYQYTEFGNDRGNIVDVASNNPESANRIRGMGAANISYGGNAMSGAIPIDTYNIDSVEINRGPNSNIFGIGAVSGTVNLNVAEANMTKDFTKLSFQVDSYGGKRASFDVNRTLIRGRLGLRILGVHDELGFVRKPSHDKTKRFTIAARAQPFKSTTIKISYETYRNSASRPNMLTPREIISQWQANGSKTWDPSTWTLYDANNAPIARYLGTDNGGTVSGVTYGGAIQLRDQHGLLGGSRIGGSNFVRPMLGYMGGDTAYFVSSQTGANGDQRLVVNNPRAITTQVNDINPATGLPYGRLFSTIDNLVSVNGEAGKALYDWTEHNLNAANYASKSSNMIKAQLEHSFFATDRQQLAMQVSGFYEDIENDSWNFIGNGGDGVAAILDIDMNRMLTDGSPNPGYLQPFLGGFSPQRYRRPEKNFTHKAQLAYLIDLTRNEGWSKHFGKHNFLAYGEYRERQYAPSALRYRSAILPLNTYTTPLPGAQVPAGFLVFPSDNLNSSYNTRFYLGDGVGINADSPTYRPTVSDTINFRYYGGSATPAVGVPLGWRSADVNISTPYFAIGTQKNEIRSKGAIWQGFLWDGRIVPTLGYREDTFRTADNKPFPVYTVGEFYAGTAVAPTYGSYLLSAAEGNEFDFRNDFLISDPKTGANVRRGITRQQGVVLKPLKWLHLTYNQSDSFDPVSFAVDTNGDILPNPTGESKDYGIRFNLLDEKLWIGFNRYEATQRDARGFAGVLANRAFRYDFDTAQSSEAQETGSIGGTDLFDFYYLNIVGNGTAAESGDPTYRTANGLTTNAQAIDHIYGLMGYTKDQIARVTSVPVTATQDMESSGYELELNYNTRFWSLKLTGAKRDAKDTAIGPALKKYIDTRLPVWQAASYTNQTPGNATFGQPESFWRTGNREEDFNGVVFNQYNILVANLGKSRPQLRPYSFSATTSYRLEGITDNSILKKIRTGAFANWSDKASIGYGYAAPELNTTTGAYVVRSLDANKRYYDKARVTADVWMAYDFRMFSGRIKSSLQFNVKNVMEDGRLQAIAVNSDGTPWAYRIVDPRKFVLSLSMEL